MSCRELKSIVASTSGYPQEFVRLVNSISEDAFARLLLEEHARSGVLNPSSSFVLEKTLICRIFEKLGFLSVEDDYYAASLTLNALFNLMAVLYSLDRAGSKEGMPVAELHATLMRDPAFQTQLMNLAPFFG
jgi:hypothetical protein